MAKIKESFIQCVHCSKKFRSPFYIGDAKTFNQRDPLGQPREVSVLQNHLRLQRSQHVLRSRCRCAECRRPQRVSARIRWGLAGVADLLRRENLLGSVDAA